ncbi:MAG TPA: hypothetical protein VI168_15970 [Croceibacterium sp.]
MIESLPPWPAYARVPPFVPVPLRARADGWTPERQARFIGLLAECGSVAEAARGVGMGRESAWRLRRRTGAGSFAHAWDVIAAIRRGEAVPQRKVTLEELAEHAFEGPCVVHMRRRRFVRAQREPGTSALLRHLRRLDAAALRGGWDL